MVKKALSEFISAEVVAAKTNPAKYMQNYWTNCSVQLATTTPATALLEVTLLRLPEEISKRARITNVYATYCGLAYSYEAGRRISLSVFKPKNVSQHDGLYTMAFNFAFSSAFYPINGASFEETIKAASLWGGLGIPIGITLGLAIDATKQMTGMETTRRFALLETISKTTAQAPKTIVAAMLASSFAATAYAYQIAPAITNYFSK